MIELQQPSNTSDPGFALEDSLVRLRFTNQPNSAIVLIKCGKSYPKAFLDPVLIAMSRKNPMTTAIFIDGSSQENVFSVDAETGKVNAVHLKDGTHLLQTVRDVMKESGDSSEWKGSRASSDASTIFAGSVLIFALPIVLSEVLSLGVPELENSSKLGVEGQPKIRVNLAIGFLAGFKIGFVLCSAIVVRLVFSLA